MHRQLFGLLILLTNVWGAESAQGGFVFVSSRAAIGGTDVIDWATLGAPGDQLTNLNPLPVTSNNGVNVDVTMAVGWFQLVKQPGWVGNFDPSDTLLWTNGFGNFGYSGYGMAGPMTLTFDQTLAAAGMQVQGNLHGPFTARIQALDALGNVLASFDSNGLSNGANNNSAIFVGIAATDGDTFSQLRLGLIAGSGDFAVNQVDFATASAVPEPASLTLFSLGGLGLAVARRRRPLPATSDRR